MRCPQCGFNNVNGANFCSNCATPLVPNPTPKPPRQTKNRKVVKLPSDHSADPKTPIERPWEAPVRKRTDASDSQAQPSGSSTKRSAATTGRIPAIKRSQYESGKIPPDQRSTSQHSNASDQPSASPEDTAPIVLDDYELSSYATERFDASFTGSSSGAPQRRSIKREAEARAASTPTRDTSGRKRGFLIALIAILIIVGLFAFGMLTAPPGSNDKTVTFDTDGGTVIGNQYIEPDGTLYRPANPTRPGYEFEGWYLDASYDEKATFPMTVTQDMTLYGRWTPIGTGDVPSTITTTPTQTPETPADGSAASSSGNGSSGSSASSGSSGTSGSSGATRPSTGSGNSSASGGGSSSGGSGSGSASGSGSGSSGSSSGVNSNPASNGPVNISLVAANGSTLSGTVTLHNGYVIPDSSEKAYTVDELRALGLNDAELCIARNEPYARLGYSFMNPGLQAYFNARSWYHNSGKRFQLPEGSAGYITAHNLLTLAEQTPGASAWLRLRTY